MRSHGPKCDPMDELKRRLQVAAEALPGVRTIERNRRNMKCDLLKAFAYWLEEEVEDGPLLILRIREPRRAELIASEAGRFYVPIVKPYESWLGVNRTIDHGRVDELVREAYESVAPRRLIDTIGE